jgi:Spy/CpxP family protein refolding chaperone
MLLCNEKIDRKAVKDLQAKINDLKSDISNIRLDSKLDGLDALTSEQRKKIHDCAIKKSFCCKFMGRRMKMKSCKRDMD